VFCERLVLPERARNVARQEAKAAVGVSLCGSCLFYVPHCCYSSYGLVFLRIRFFFTSKYQITCLRSYYSPFHFSGWFSFPLHPPSQKRGSNFFSDKKTQRDGRPCWTLDIGSESCLKTNLVWTKVKMDSDGRRMAFQHSRGGTVQEEVGTGEQFKWKIKNTKCSI